MLIPGLNRKHQTLNFKLFSRNFVQNKFKMSLTEQQLDAIGEKLVEKFKSIYDPEIPVDIYELGLIYDALVNNDGEAKIIMTLTSPNCPVAESLPNEVREKVEQIEGIEKAEVEITFDPPWDRDMMSEEAKFELGML
ncbi:FeS assembly SUF system protein [Moheibacter sediminis]|uniref:FeS assembly SUF system protein n=2 Tax=Moheibacter sediminis TaxID=1434700 RepID=A0A1W1YEA7_9FLAO|nr:FeS assembly SUF system protein [Moheibacter sediminis]